MHGPYTLPSTKPLISLRLSGWEKFPGAKSNYVFRQIAISEIEVLG